MYSDSSRNPRRIELDDCKIMPTPYLQLYMHLVWSTWDRRPLLSRTHQPSVHAAIAERCRVLHCLPLAVGGTEDHVHTLVSLRPAISVSMLVQEIKGYSSYLVTHQLQPGMFFKWQGSYGAFAVTKRDLERVRSYVVDPLRHHTSNTVIQELEATCEQLHRSSSSSVHLDAQ